MATRTLKQRYSDNLEIEFDSCNMEIILTFEFDNLSELKDFLKYRKQFELADFKDLKHTNATSEFKTWIESQIRTEIENDDMYENWEFRFCGGEETNEKEFKHEIFYSVEPHLDGNFLHY